MQEVALLATHPWVIDGIDVLVINHGRYDRVDAKDLDIDHLRRTMTTNFEGAFLTQTPLKSNLTDNARICVIGSQLGTKGSPHGAGLFSIESRTFDMGTLLAQSLAPEGKSKCGRTGVC